MTEGRAIRSIAVCIWIIAGLNLILSVLTIGSAHHLPYADWSVVYLIATGAGLYRCRWWGAGLLVPPVIFSSFIFSRRAFDLAMDTPVVAIVQVILALLLAMPLVVVIRCRSSLKAGL